jgi:subtilase family serine protease
MLLQLRRSPAQEQAVETLIDQLHNPSSPNFHKWLTTAQIAARFGLATSDIQAVTRWLAQSGFAVNTVYPGGMVIDFSGTAGQVRNAFHTEIHHLSVDGVAQIANMSDPKIPTALAPAIVGIASLHDFRPQFDYTIGGSTSNPLYSVVPADLWTIYNFTQAFAAGYTGVNQTIYLIEESLMYDTADWTAFYQSFLSKSFPNTQMPQPFAPVAPSSPNYNNNCKLPNPPAQGKYSEAAQEATLDAEYASAAAPGATIMMATCLPQPSTGSSGQTTPGTQIAILNVIYGNYAPGVISLSDHMGETQLLQAGNNLIYSAYQHGMMKGFSIYVSAGDAGAAVNDKGASTPALYGINVNGYASTPYNVAVGGTDFADTYLKQNSTYWNPTNNPAGTPLPYGSARSYIPEIPWNSTCGSQLYASNQGFATALAYCNSLTSGSTLLNPSAGSGGPSACAYGTAATLWVVSGNCTGYPRPSWQNGVIGLPRSGVGSGVRVLPDVALFVANAPWRHTYTWCYSGPNKQGVSTNCMANMPATWQVSGGGTSFAAPIMAGIQALINQRKGQPQGNPNPRLYQLAAQEYGTWGNPKCNSINGKNIAPSCIFHDIAMGDNVVPCYDWSYAGVTGTTQSGVPQPPASVAPATVPINCYGLGTSTTPPMNQPTAPPVGVMSNSNTSNVPAFQAGLGWDFATGLGSVNVYNLVTNW